ncbi:MAG: ABC transporter ATP-binding protein [Myxococcota bacterium]
MTTIIRCERISRIFNPGENEVRALDQLFLTIQSGDMVAIAGPSGSGKSTLLNMIGCLDRPDQGAVFLEDLEVSKASSTTLSDVRNDKIGFIFQSFHLIPVLSVFENVEFALQIGGKYTAAQRKERVMPLLQRLGIERMAHRRPGEISGGQQQRVAIARALVKKPLMILADEPTANLDSKTAWSIMELMIQLNEDEHTTFVFSTHDPMVMEAAPRLIKLRDGVIISDQQQQVAHSRAEHARNANEPKEHADVPA